MSGSLSWGQRCVSTITPQDFAEAVLDFTGGKGVDVILDFVGGPYLNKNLACCATDARVVSLAALGGARVADFTMAPFLRKRIQLTGTTMRSRSDRYRQQLTADFRDKIWPPLRRWHPGAGGRYHL